MRSTEAHITQVTDFRRNVTHRVLDKGVGRRCVVPLAQSSSHALTVRRCVAWSMGLREKTLQTIGLISSCRICG